MTIDWTVWFPVLYVGLMAGACVFAVAWMIATAMQRQAQGKPLVTPALPYTLFRETRVSAYVGQPRFRWSYSGVRRGMLVAVTPQHLILAPQFPNSLMFLSGGEAFEHTVPLGEILRVERARAAFATGHARASAEEGDVAVDADIEVFDGVRIDHEIRGGDVAHERLLVCDVTIARDLAEVLRHVVGDGRGVLSHDGIVPRVRLASQLSDHAGGVVVRSAARGRAAGLPRDEQREWGEREQSEQRA